MKKIALAFVFALAFTACGKKDGPVVTNTAPTPSTTSAPAIVTVSTVTVGNAVGADKRIQGAATITPRDTIYVSIDTTGVGDATLKSRWTYLKDGKTTLVKEDTQRVSASGPATHEFHISKPDGWPQGDYQVEVFVNDTPAGSRRFMVS